MVEEFLSAERTHRILAASASGPRLVWNKKGGIKIRHCIEAASGPNVFQLPCCFGFFNTFAERQKNEAGVFAKHQKTVYKLIVNWYHFISIQPLRCHTDPWGSCNVPGNCHWGDFHPQKRHEGIHCCFKMKFSKDLLPTKVFFDHGFISFIPSLLLWHR